MSRFRIILIIAALFSFFSVAAETKPDSVFCNLENQIVGLASQLSASRYKDALQDTFAVQIRQLLGETLKREGSFEYPFDSLKNDVCQVVSPDGRVRIFTWFAVGDAGNYHYYGYLQYHDKQAKKVRLFELTDNGAQLESYDNQTFTPQNWRGMLYYGIVEKKHQGEVIYPLLGWDG